jgi:ABC-type multidrug transport system ATPase subunit
MYCAGTFSVPITGVLGSNKTTNINQASSLMKRSMGSTTLLWTDRNIQQQKFMHATGFAGINFWTNDTL